MTVRSPVGVPAGLRGRLRPAAAAAILLVGLTGCTGAAARDGADAARPDRSATATPEGPGPSDRPDPALAGEPVPTLPPGDPGVGGDVDAADDDSAGDHGDDHGGEVAAVPAAAFVDEETLAALAGGDWTAAADPGDCTSAPPPGAVASRSVTLAGSGGQLVQVVGAYESVRASNAAVAAAVAALGRCGFQEAGDPRLGTASVELARPARDTTAGESDAEQRAMVLAAEGVTVVLVATGSPAAAGAWESLADVALGTSCAAAAPGCH